MNTKLLVNGKLVKGKGDELGVLDPATGKVIAQVAEASEEQITAAVKAKLAAEQGTTTLTGINVDTSEAP